MSALINPNARVKRALFGQLYSEIKAWPGMDNSLRRSYLGKGHGGQRRAFKVAYWSSVYCMSIDSVIAISRIPKTTWI